MEPLYISNMSDDAADGGGGGDSSGDEERAAFEEDARREWKNAGYYPGAFSIEAYQEKFTAARLDNVDQEWRLNDISGVSNLQEKAAIIDMERERALTAAKVKTAAVNFANARATDVLRAGLAVTDFFEPGFMRRARQRRRHLRRIERSEAEADRVVLERNEAQGRRRQWAKLERVAVAERDARVREAGPTVKISHDVERVVEQEERLAQSQGKDPPPHEN